MKARIAMAAVAMALVGGCTVVPPDPQVAPPVVEAPAAAPPAPAEPAATPGIATTGTNRWYKDQYGRCYRVNEQGDRVYDAARQC